MLFGDLLFSGCVCPDQHRPSLVCQYIKMNALIVHPRFLAADALWRLENDLVAQVHLTQGLHLVCIRTFLNTHLLAHGCNNSHSWQHYICDNLTTITNIFGLTPSAKTFSYASFVSTPLTMLHLDFPSIHTPNYSDIHGLLHIVLLGNLLELSDALRLRRWNLSMLEQKHRAYVQKSFKEFKELFTMWYSVRTENLSPLHCDQFFNETLK